MTEDKMSVNIRKIALKLLRSYELEQRYVNLLMNTAPLSDLTKEDSARVTALLYTVVERKITYDYLICALAGRSMESIDPYVRDVLRIGLCQILHMEKIPDFAAVNETVKLGRHNGERSFINAVLREAVKRKASLPYPDRSKNALRYMSVIYSVPLATVKLFAEIFGETECEELLVAFSKQSPLSVTVNTKKTTKDALLSKLSEFGAEPEKYSDFGIRFSTSLSPKVLPGFSEGEFFVQDEASRIEAVALDVGEGETVIDVCSAPGGKSFSAAIRVGSRGRVYSFDLHESKLSLISDGAQRLGLENIEVRCKDATLPDDTLFGKADRVICDVPCSGLGVFSKKPDLRYKDISAIDELPPLQYSILESSAKYLKKGGVLVYSTCTFNPDENEAVTDKFIERNNNFVYEPFSAGELFAKDGKLTLLPHKHGTDGFYIAKLRKIQ